MSQLFHNLCLIDFKNIINPVGIYIILQEFHYFINMSDYGKVLIKF